jgi:hypothetical protein
MSEYKQWFFWIKTIEILVAVAKSQTIKSNGALEIGAIRHTAVDERAKRVRDVCKERCGPAVTLSDFETSLSMLEKVVPYAGDSVCRVKLFVYFVAVRGYVAVAATNSPMPPWLLY